MAGVVKEKFWNRIPLIVILGATGTGKSKLALEVAQKFNGEIISADAMQVYRGLDIITNKVTPEEQRLVPHYMIDYLGPSQPTTVKDYRDKALPILKEILDRKKMPIIAGGTNYYVESLLWHVLVDTLPKDTPERRFKIEGLGGLGGLEYLVTQDPIERDTTRDVVEALNDEEKKRFHEVLKEVDPARAEELHPNNVRKVIRSLQVYSTTGKRHSDMIKKQKEFGNDKGGPLRFQHCVVFWLTCDKEMLHQRLDSRVDQMISNGLIEELQAFHDQHNKQRIKQEEGEPSQPAYTLGIFQCIGFKEFHDYLMLDTAKRESEEGKKLFTKGVELMKLATRQYANYQQKWIRRRFLARGGLQVPPVYSLNATFLSRWNEEVRDKACSVIQAMLEGRPTPFKPEKILPSSEVIHKLSKCEECDRLFESPQQLKEHLSSQKHRRTVNRLKRLNEPEAEPPIHSIKRIRSRGYKRKEKNKTVQTWPQT